MSSPATTRPRLACHPSAPTIAIVTAALAAGLAAVLGVAIPAPAWWLVLAAAAGYSISGSV